MFICNKCVFWKCFDYLISWLDYLETAYIFMKLENEHVEFFDLTYLKKLNYIYQTKLTLFVRENKFEQW